MSGYCEDCGNTLCLCGDETRPEMNSVLVAAAIALLREIIDNGGSASNKQLFAGRDILKRLRWGVPPE